MANDTPALTLGQALRQYLDARNAALVAARASLGISDTDARALLFAVHLDGVSVAISGDRHNYFERGGRRYAHIIDPRTGRPADNGVALVTVVHPSAARADALATAITVLGPADGMELARRLDLAVAIVVRRGGSFEILQTDAMQRVRVNEAATQRSEDAR